MLPQRHGFSSGVISKIKTKTFIYISGIAALNIHRNNETSGDWHPRKAREDDCRESKDERGLNWFERIEVEGEVLEGVWVANHYRALADMFRESVNKRKINMPRHSVNDFLDGDTKGLLEYIDFLSIEDETTKLVCIHEFGREVVERWLTKSSMEK